MAQKQEVEKVGNSRSGSTGCQLRSTRPLSSTNASHSETGGKTGSLLEPAAVGGDHKVNGMEGFDVQLSRTTSVSGNGSNTSTAGFVNGDFATGKVCDVPLTDKSFVMAYEPVAASLLVVGTASSLDFYHCADHSYTLIHSFRTRAMISAVRWIAPPKTTNTNTGMDHSNDAAMNATSIGSVPLNSFYHKTLMLAAADLSGRVYLYSIDWEILESQGPTLLYEEDANESTSQIRSLDAGYYGRLCEILVVVVGDKSGFVTLVSFHSTTTTSSQPVFRNKKQVYPREHKHVSKSSCLRVGGTKMAGVLGLALDVSCGLLAFCTTDGLVQVRSLSHAIDAYHTQNSEDDSVVWSVQNAGGAVRCVTFSAPQHHLLAFGGYDKTVVLVDTQQWVVSRELAVQGTVNTIAFDPQDRYLSVGCRDKTFVLFDTSTSVAVKVFHTQSWVTSISWASDAYVAIRSETRTVSVLDLSPIQQTGVSLPSLQQPGPDIASTLSWSRNGQFLARAVGSTIAIVDTFVTDNDHQFRHVISYDMTVKSNVMRVVFCHSVDKADWISAVDDAGRLVVLRLSNPAGPYAALFVVKTKEVEPFLKALAWSPDGTQLACGGRKKLLHLFSADTLLPLTQTPICFGGRIWDIDFVPSTLALSGSSRYHLGIALGDYTTAILDDAFEMVLQISRSLTCRCLKFHQTIRVLVIGDGAGTVAVVDYDSGELVLELDVGGRVNELDFSPAGDYLIVGTDACQFSMYESVGFQLLQETTTLGFAQSASFSPNGLYLALGAEKEAYRLIRLGPFLGNDLVPLTLIDEASRLPPGVRESLYRSCDGPSFLQRHMVRGGPDNLKRVAKILHDHPNSIYTFDRRTGEGCFDTAMRLQKPGLVKLFITSLVDGTFNPSTDKEKNFLTTNIPQRGRDTLADIVEHYPPEYIIDILKTMTFMKVPFTGPRVVESGERIECGSKFYTDPWSDPASGGRRLERSTTSSKLVLRGGSVRTPAVLPLPRLGDMDFLSSLIALPDAFDCEAMAVVLRVMWRHHIRRYYYVDCCLYAAFYISWIILVEMGTHNRSFKLGDTTSATKMVLVVVAFNTLFAVKELVEARYGKRRMYWFSLWNTCDMTAGVFVYAYCAEILVTGDSLIPLAVCTTLFLTIKLLSYLRGFSSTGWLLSVLTANFRDVRGFLIILSIILVGFSVIFRVLFDETDDESFSTLRRSFLSTFELTVTGTYDTALLFETRHTVLAVISFILAVTCVLVVALNALISILGDSYARVQEHAVANRRREVASLIVEYMCLLPAWKRRQIESQTTWFHTLLEVDADGSLHVQTDDWEGGMNALRRDMEELSRSNNQSYEKHLEHLKADLDTDLARFKKEVVSLLEDLTDDVKFLRKAQSQGILKFDAKQNVAKAVRAVQSVGRRGGALFKFEDG